MTIIIASTFDIEEQAAHAVRTLNRAGMPAAMLGRFSARTQEAASPLGIFLRRLGFGAAIGFAIGSLSGIAAAVATMILGALGGAVSSLLPPPWGWNQVDALPANEGAVLIAVNAPGNEAELHALRALREMGAVEIKIVRST